MICQQVKNVVVFFFLCVLELSLLLAVIIIAVVVFYREEIHERIYPIEQLDTKSENERQSDNEFQGEKP